MIHTPISFDNALDILITVLTLSLALCFIRLYLGPSIPNRTMAFDSIAIHAVAMLALYAVRIDAPSILDAAIVTAVLGFLGTTMMARYLERAAPRYYTLQQNRAKLEHDIEEKVVAIETHHSTSPSSTPKELPGNQGHSNEGRGEVT